MAQGCKNQSGRVRCWMEGGGVYSRVGRSTVSAKGTQGFVAQGHDTSH